MPDINLLKDTTNVEKDNKKSKSSDSLKRSEKDMKKPENDKPGFFKRIFSGNKKSDKKIKKYNKYSSSKKEKKQENKEINKKDRKLEDTFIGKSDRKESESSKKIEYKKPVESEKTGEKKDIQRKNSFKFKDEEVEDIFSSNSNKGEKTEKSEPERKTDKKTLPSQKKSEKGKSKKEKKEKKAKTTQSDSFLVNLMPEEVTRGEEPKKKLINLALFSLGAIVLVLLVYGGLVFYQTRIVTETQAVKAERTDLDSKIRNLKKEQEKSVDFNERLEAIKNVLNTHIYWSKFFEKLENYTLKDVYYTGSFNGSTQSQITLSAVAPDYNTVAEQLLIFQNADDFLTDVSITGASKSSSQGQRADIGENESKVSFSVSLDILPSVFYEIIEEDSNEQSEESSNNTNLNTNISINNNNNVNINSSNNNFNVNSSIILNGNTNSNSNTNNSYNFNTNSNSNTQNTNSNILSTE